MLMSRSRIFICSFWSILALAIEVEAWTNRKITNSGMQEIGPKIYQWPKRKETFSRSLEPILREGGRSFVGAIGNLHATTGSAVSSTSREFDLPRITTEQLDELSRKKYVVIRDFLPNDLQEALRSDMQNLVKSSKFRTAGIGQDATNALNENIRVAQTCFLGPEKLQDIPDSAREHLYDVLGGVRGDLMEKFDTPLDGLLTELLYVRYPQGGFYRRHRDAIPGSASTLRKYSLLLYLNDEDWDATKDAGQLRIHLDSGGDEVPEGEEPNFLDVDPLGGTLVLFESDKIPHEVLDTNRERMAVVGWYNRPVSVSDVAELSGMDSTRLVMLGAAASLITIGLVGLFNS